MAWPRFLLWHERLSLPLPLHHPCNANTMKEANHVPQDWVDHTLRSTATDRRRMAGEWGERVCLPRTDAASGPVLAGRVNFTPHPVPGFLPRLQQVPSGCSCVCWTGSMERGAGLWAANPPTNRGLPRRGQEKVEVCLGVCTGKDPKDLWRGYPTLDGGLKEFIRNSD